MGTEGKVAIWNLSVLGVWVWVTRISTRIAMDFGNSEFQGIHSLSIGKLFHERLIG